MRVLFVSIAFPPKNDPECIQTAKYFKYLKDICTVDVVTSAHPTLFMPYDKKLESYAVGYDQLIEVPIKENKYINFVKRKLGSKQNEKPDSKRSFHQGSGQVIEELKQTPDIIYSRSYPLSSLLMAEKLRDHYNVPWVIHLSDPWSVSPMHEYQGELLKWHQENEYRAFEKASRICLTSEKTLIRYSRLYPEFKDKFHLSMNVYDPEKTVNGDFKPGKTRKIVYTGGLSGSRTPESILKAFRQMEGEAFEKPVDLHFAGAYDTHSKSVMDSFKSSYLTDHGLVSYPESKDLQNSADILLLMDTPLENPDNALYFPSKLLDYLQTGKPILAVTYYNSTVDELMNESHGTKIYYGEEAKWAEQISAYLRSFKSPGSERMYPLPEEFSATHQVKRLHELFKSLLS